MRIKRKVISIISTLALAVLGIGFTNTPASAADSLGGHNSSSVENLTYGTFADLDYTCLTDSTDYYLVNLDWGSPLVLPAGMSYDSITHHISGTPTELGTFQLPIMWCEGQDPISGSPIANTGNPSGSIVVNAPITEPTPAGPRVTLLTLNDYWCSFNMTLDFPEYWDAGSMTLVFSQGSSSLTLHDIDLDTLHGTWRVYPSSADQLATDYPADWRYDGERQGNSIGCNAKLTVAVDYTVNGQAVQTGYGQVRPIRDDYHLSGKISVDDGVCVADIEYRLALSPEDDSEFDGPTYFSLESWDGSAKLDFVLEESLRGDEGKLSIDFNQMKITAFQENGIPRDPAGLNMKSQGTLSCGQGIYLSISASTSPGLPAWELAGQDLSPHAPCGKGSFGPQSLGYKTWDEDCIEAPIGSYVDVTGAKVAKSCPNGMTTITTGAASIKDCFYPAAACGKGTYSPTGHDSLDDPCIDAPIGTFVNIKGAMVATDCPNGMTTEAPGAASQYDCFRPSLPTIKKIVFPKISKFGSVLKLAGKTDQGTNLNMTATGACVLQPVYVGVNQTFKVTMNKKAGVCSIRVFAKRAGRYTALTKTIAIKVTKTGK